MILQTIKLPFDAGTADTIYTKQGETGRGIWFDLPFLIGEEEIPDYKAEFIAVKPDDTFVIEDATLTNHGDGEDIHSVCYLTLPEQVSAAKGTGSYILKVYDFAHDNDLIYSAAGGLYVDDHLLLDSMIESIAQVNGYNFPDDFLTIGDLGNLINDNVTAEDTTWSSHKIDEEITDAAAALQHDIDGIIDDDVTSSDTTWSSQKLADVTENIEVIHTYSTNETVAGTWIDGNTLYRRVIHYNAVSGLSTGTHVIGTYDNTVRIKDIKSCADENGYYYEMPYIGSYGNNNISAAATGGNIIIKIESTSFAAGTDIWVTILYTKS